MRTPYDVGASDISRPDALGETIGEWMGRSIGGIDRGVGARQADARTDLGEEGIYGFGGRGMKEFSLIAFSDVALDIAIDFQVMIDAADQPLAIQFVVTGELDRLQLPPVSQSPKRITGLWETTCFEFFFGVPQQDNYWEVNLSPSGDWNVFRLDRYRENLQEEQAIVALPLTVKREGDRLTLALTFDLQVLGLEWGAIELSATSVIQESTGEISYWAVNHAGLEADFHLRDSFVIGLSSEGESRESKVS